MVGLFNLATLVTPIEKDLGGNLGSPYQCNNKEREREREREGKR
jgi:hypothetical protein